jgi:hypothetical protein
MRKRIPKDMPRPFGPIGPAKEVASYRVRVGQGSRPAPVGPDPRKNSNGSLIFKFQGFLEFGKTWRNYTMRFKRNLDMGNFPKFF